MESVSENTPKITDLIPKDRLAAYLKTVSAILGVQVSVLDVTGAGIISVPPDGPGLPFDMPSGSLGSAPVELEGPDGKTLITAPFFYKEKPLGYLAASGAGPLRDGGGLPVLTLSGAHLGFLAESGNELDSLSAEVIKVYEELALIYGLTKMLGAKVGVDEICRAVAEEAEKVLHPTDVMVMLAEEENGALRTVAALGVHMELSAAFAPGQEEGLIGRSLVGQKSVLVCDVNVDRRHKGWPYPINRLLVVPLVVGERPIGVIAASDKRNGIEFDSREEKLVSAIASVAAIAIRNAQLYTDITRLLEGIMQASVTAFESRDPATAGHSARVAEMTVELAKRVAESGLPVFQKVTFSEPQLLEMRYACLLHDIGKISVRESVLLKEAKLETRRIENIRGRFAVIAERKKCEALEAKLRAAEEGPGEPYRVKATEIDASLSEELSRLMKYLELIEMANDPHVLVTDLPELGMLDEAAGYRYAGPAGEALPLLTPEELKDLHIQRGSLNSDERLEVESHVTHSYNFLNKIPWTKDFRHITGIVHAHHEKLDGSGYPRGIAGDDIPIQARIMAVADIFDALTAGDRPYKKAVSTQKALFILDLEASEGKIDPHLVQIFTDARVYEAARRAMPLAPTAAKGK